ncbi:MAG: hypothetical protein WC823_03535 [Parcubacteria group bacterium]|jgi:hypothetical protein
MNCLIVLNIEKKAKGIDMLFENMDVPAYISEALPIFKEVFKHIDVVSIWEGYHLLMFAEQAYDVIVTETCFKDGAENSMQRLCAFSRMWCKGFGKNSSLRVIGDFGVTTQLLKVPSEIEEKELESSAFLKKCEMVYGYYNHSLEISKDNWRKFLQGGD